MSKRKKGKKSSEWNRFVSKHRKAGKSMKQIAAMWKNRGKAYGKAHRRHKGGAREAFFAQRREKFESASRRAWRKTRARKLQRAIFKAKGYHRDQQKKLNQLMREFDHANYEERKRLKAKIAEQKKKTHHAKKKVHAAQTAAEFPKGWDEHSGGYASTYDSGDRHVRSENDPGGRRRKKAKKGRKKARKGSRKLSAGLKRYQAFKRKHKHLGKRAFKKAWNKEKARHKPAARKSRKTTHKRKTKRHAKKGYARRSRRF